MSAPATVADGAAPAYASMGRRIGGYLVDNLIGLVVTLGGYGVVIGGLVGNSTAVALVGFLALTVGLLVWTAYYLVVLGRRGATPGHRMLGLRVVGADSGEPIGLGRAFLRQLVLGLLGPLNVIQLFTIPGSSRRQGWHDSLVGSVVVVAGVKPAVPAAELASPTPIKAPSAVGPQSALASLGGLHDAGVGVAGPGVGMVPPPPATVAPPPTVPPASVPAPPATPVAGVLRPPLQQPPAPAPAVRAPAPIAEPPAAGPTAVETGVALPVVGEPPAETQVVRRTAASWVLSIDDGGTRVVDGLVLVGRAPDTTLVEGSSVWEVQEPTVSKTHALFGVADGVAFVEDWHSTNGVRLTRQGNERDVPPHDRTALATGDLLELGDLRITVKENR